MKRNTLFFILMLILAGEFANAQLQGAATCPPFKVDVMEGSVNELYPKSAIVEIKTVFPCSSITVEKDSVSKCAGVFFKDKGIYFYTERKYIEIGEHFNGKINPSLMGVSRNNLFKLLGYPKLKNTDWDAFQMGYGTLILYYNKAGRINKIQMSSKNTEAIKLCE